MGRYNASRGYHKALSRWLPSFDVVKVRAAPAFLAQLRRRIIHRNIAPRLLSHACKSDIPVGFIWLPMARCIGCACALHYTERCCAASMLFHRIGRWWLATCHPGFREGSRLPRVYPTAWGRHADKPRLRGGPASAGRRASGQQRPVAATHDAGLTRAVGPGRGRPSPAAVAAPGGAPK